MDFNLTEQQRALKETAKKFAEKELIEVAREIEKNDKPPSKEILKRFAELGFLGINLPEKIWWSRS